MVGASSLAFPGSRTLSDWRRQLAPYHPLGLWVGYLFLHFVEAPVLQRKTQEVDLLTRRFLEAVALAAKLGVTAESAHAHLQALLALGAGPLHRLLSSLARAGLLDERIGQPQLSAAGRQALAQGHYPAHVPQRRVFPFVEHLDAQGQRLAPPQFLPLDDVAEASPWPAHQEHGFDPAWLHSYLSAPEESKRRAGFPLDVAHAPAADSWREVVLDRTERLVIVLVRTAREDQAAWMGFPARPDGWLLHASRPVARVPVESEALAFPQPTLDDWRRSWQDWCRTRNLPAQEVETCQLEVEPMRLRLAAPQKLVDRLGSAKTELLKGESWLLAGEGYLRAALPVELRH